MIQRNYLYQRNKMQVKVEPCEVMVMVMVMRRLWGAEGGFLLVS